MKRVQRKRTRDWRMPPNTVYVGRPTKWGNPYTLANFNRERAITEYAEWLRQQLLADDTFLDPLKGKDLACWCPLDKSCHVDVLLKVLESM